MKRIIFLLLLILCLSLSLSAYDYLYTDAGTSGGIAVIPDSLSFRVLVVEGMTVENATIDTLSATTGIIESDSTQASTNMLNLNVPDNAIDGQHYKIHVTAADTSVVMTFDVVATGVGNGIYTDSTQVQVFGDLHVSGNFSNYNPRAFAYVSVADTTVLATIGTRYPIQGTFTNEDSKFSAVTNGIQLDGENGWYEIFGSISAQCSSANEEVFLEAVKNYTTLCAGSTKSRTLELNKTGSWPSTFHIYLETGDIITWTYRTETTAGCYMTTYEFQTTAKVIP